MNHFFQEENTTVVDAATNKRSCKLDPKVQSLLELICDLKAMEECVLEMKFDTRKAPLGSAEAKIVEFCSDVLRISETFLLSA